VVRSVFGLNTPDYRTALIEEGPLVASINASGILNPVKQVTVGSQVTGMVKELLVDFNSPVKQGQVIALIDPRDFQAKYDQALANYTLAQKNHQFNLKLIEKGFISPQALVQTDAAYKTAEAALRSAKKSLDDTVIRAPVDGVVVKRSVEVGQTVAASLQTPEIFIIAKNLAEMQVDTAIDEADVGRLSEGLSGNFTVDAFPGRIFKSKITQIRKAPTTIQNVVTYTVILSADNPDLKLLPGMTANVRIVIDKREKVLKVPNAALRFRMPAAGDIPSSVAPSSAAPAAGGARKGGGGGGNRGGVPTIRRIWMLQDEGLRSKAVQRMIKIGLTDGNFTEILPDDDAKLPPLKVGDEVIIGIQSPDSKSSGAASSSPSRPAGPRMF
jgi:HlyD family secretion protein